MTTLVTGGCGFVGLNLAEELLAKGESVVLLDRNPLPRDALRVLDRHSGRLIVAAADVCDAARVAEIFKTFGVRRVIHTAVITAGAQRESDETKQVIDVNLNGTVNVLRAAKDSLCGRIVSVGSGAAYGKTLLEGQPLREETSPSRPDTIYGITKLASEQTALRLAELWDLDVVCVRIGTVFGPWELDTGVRDLLTPQWQVARVAVAGGEAIVPAIEPRRDWIYSRDVASGLIAVLEHAAPRYRLYHLSSGIEWEGGFAQWCDTLRQAYPKFSWRVAANGEKPNVSFVVEGDRAPMLIGRITKDIGFQPRCRPSDAHADYIRWIVEHEAFIEA